MKKIDDPLRIVFDTNVYVSAFLTKQGTPAQAINYSFATAQVLVSKKLITEVRRIVVDKFGLDATPLETLLSKAEIIAVTPRVKFEKDPKDAFLLDLCEQGQADYLITGDSKHLLPLGTRENTRIISPKLFLDL